MREKGYSMLRRRVSDGAAPGAFDAINFVSDKIEVRVISHIT